MKTLSKALSRLISVLAAAVIAVLAVPAGILALLIYGVWSAANRLTAALCPNDGEEDTE